MYFLTSVEQQVTERTKPHNPDTAYKVYCRNHLNNEFGQEEAQ